jgi:hypothetical protein
VVAYLVESRVVAYLVESRVVAYLVESRVATNNTASLSHTIYYWKFQRRRTTRLLRR